MCARAGGVTDDRQDGNRPAAQLRKAGAGTPAANAVAMRWFVLISVGVLAGSLTLWRLVDNAPVAAPAATNVRPAVDVPNAVVSPAPAASAVRAPRDMNARAPADVPGDVVAQHDPDGAAMDAAFERRFAADTTDAAWSATMIDQLRQTFAEPALAGSTLDNADCRGSMCRLVVAHADGAAESRFFTAAGATPAFRGAGASRRLVDPAAPDRIRTLVFVMREGEPLPAL